MNTYQFNSAILILVLGGLIGLPQISQSQTPTTVNVLTGVIPKHSASPPMVQFDQPAVETAGERERRKVRDRQSLGIYTGKVIIDPGTPVVNDEAETVDLTFIDGVRIARAGEIKDPPGLPISNTSVVVGRITSGKAYLNDDHTGVFSEYLMVVKDVLKSEPPARLSVGDEVNLWRPGGSLRFHSGHIKHFVIAGRGFPEGGRDYLFLLRTTDSGLNDYAISTAFSLDDHGVYSLDDHQDQRSFDGALPMDFLNTVRKEILVRRPQTKH